MNRDMAICNALTTLSGKRRCMKSLGIVATLGHVWVALDH